MWPREHDEPGASQQLSQERGPTDEKAGTQMKAHLCIFAFLTARSNCVCAHTRASVQVIKCLPSQGPFLGTMEMILLSCL